MIRDLPQPVDHGPPITLHSWPDKTRIVPLDSLLVSVPFGRYRLETGQLPELGVLLGEGPKTYQVRRLEINDRGQLCESYTKRWAKEQARPVSQALLVAIFNAAETRHAYDAKIEQLRKTAAQAVQDHLTGFGRELSGEIT